MVGIANSEGVYYDVPARAVRRYAPARHDRHGACLQPQNYHCDEPTTALDVTIQAQILDLLRS